MSIKSTLVEALESFLRAKLRDVNTSMPGRVEKYYPDTQTADIKPMLKTHTNVEYPVIPDVPVMFPGGGGYKLTWPLAEGDSVSLLFAQASIDSWANNAELLDRPNANTFDLSDAVAFPGLLPMRAPSDQVSDGFVLSGDKIQLGSKDASDPLVRQSDLEALVSYIKSHVHLGVTTGAGTSGIPGTPPNDVTGSPDILAD